VDKEEEQARKIAGELAKLDEHHVKAFRDKDRVIFMIQDAPEELRRLADALEKINVREIQALIAFKPQEPPRGEK
jgi:low affinity Fe/Cu permease